MWKLLENSPYFTSCLLKVSFSGPVLTLHLVALENLAWAHGPEPTWSLEISFGSKGIQNQKFRFSPYFSY